MGGVPGSGAGRGGGGGGSIREAGGSFGKRQAAQEDQFFHNQQKEQLEKIKNRASGPQKKEVRDKDSKDAMHDEEESGQALVMPEPSNSEMRSGEAGGAFGKKEAAQEDQFFYNQQKQQLEKIKILH